MKIKPGHVSLQCLMRRCRLRGREPTPHFSGWVNFSNIAVDRKFQISTCLIFFGLTRWSNLRKGWEFPTTPWARDLAQFGNSRRVINHSGPFVTPFPKNGGAIICLKNACLTNGGWGWERRPYCQLLRENWDERSAKIRNLSLDISCVRTNGSGNAQLPSRFPESLDYLARLLIG